MTEEDAWKAGADRYAHYFGDIRRHLSTEFAAEIRWITASLFALNAGGLLQVANSEKFGLPQKYAGCAFWVGILLAFAFVSYSQYKTAKFLSIVQQIENCWVVTAATGVPGGEKLVGLEREKALIKTSLSKAFSISSFSMFSVGLFFLAWAK